MYKKQIFHILLIVLSVFVLQLSSCTNAKDELLQQITKCDTTAVSFSSQVMPIMDASCTSCHAGSSPSANISLSNYTEVKNASSNANFLGSIQHSSGYSAMPQGASKLDDCSILKISSWIQQGAQNN